MTDVLLRLAAVALATVAGLGLVEVLHRALAPLGRRSAFASDLSRHTRRAFRLLVAVAVIATGLRVTGLGGDWRAWVIHALYLVAIGATAWLLTGLLFVTEDLALARYRTDVRDNRYARTIHTQVRVLRRVTAVAVAMLALGAMLMTFREVRLVGTSMLASAGVAAAVAAFAAQTLLGNLFAGLQIAFGKSLRLDDVVVVENEWGRIEEITLTYVVVHVWDDRRVILPTSYFTTHPFENWTRSESSLLGAVELDVDWTVPVDELREELRAILTDSPLWDGRVSVLQVTDAVGGTIRLRALVSAADAGALWDLRCLVRERVVGWLRDRRPEALPRVRARVGPEPDRRPVHHDSPGPFANVDAHVFGGDAAGLRRRREFTGPDQEREVPVPRQPR